MEASRPRWAPVVGVSPPLSWSTTPVTVSLDGGALPSRPTTSCVLGATGMRLSGVGGAVEGRLAMRPDRSLESILNANATPKSTRRDKVSVFTTFARSCPSDLHPPTLGRLPRRTPDEITFYDGGEESRGGSEPERDIGGDEVVAAQASASMDAALLCFHARQRGESGSNERPRAAPRLLTTRIVPRGGDAARESLTVTKTTVFLEPCVAPWSSAEESFASTLGRALTAVRRSTERAGARDLPPPPPRRVGTAGGVFSQTRSGVRSAT